MTGSMSDFAVKIDGARYFEKLRAEKPVAFDSGYNAYVVTRHEEALQVLREATLFSSAQAIFSSFNFEEVVNAILNERGRGPLIKVLPMTDPPEHTRVRALVNLAFSAKRVTKIRGFIEQLTSELTDNVIDQGRMEVVADFAQPLPVTVIGDLLCLPRERWQDVIRWTRAYTSCAGNLITTREQAEQVGADLAEMQNFIVAHLDERRASPGDDVLTDLLQASVSGFEPLSEAEILAVAVAFVGAGHETSTVAITELFKTLAEHPQVVESLRTASDQPAAIKIFCEEFLRLHPPLNAQPRVTTADTEIGGVAIPRGSFVLVANASANRDERVFGADAEALNPVRPGANRHLTFGGGVHVCLGNMLARAELQSATAAIVNRLGNLRLANRDIPSSDYGPVIMDWNYHVKRLEVTFEKLT